MPINLEEKETRNVRQMDEKTKESIAKLREDYFKLRKSLQELNSISKLNVINVQQLIRPIWNHIQDLELELKDN